MKHKTEDYKISAVKYYLKENKSLDEVCDIFSCKKQSLSRQVNSYKKDKSIKRYSRKPVEKAISKIKPINYKNYFQYAYQKDTYPKYDRNKSTLRKKYKNYK